MKYLNTHDRLSIVEDGDPELTIKIDLDKIDEKTPYFQAIFQNNEYFTSFLSQVQEERKIYIELKTENNKRLWC